jgi:hypothetical protein
MIKIIESPYYFSIYSNDLLDKEKYNFFGMLSGKQNRFYILHRNHSLLKFLQILLSKNFYTFSIVSFKYFSFDAHKEIDNHDCCEWGGTPNMTDTLELEANTSILESKLIKNNFNSFTVSEVELQEKMFFIMNILTKIASLFKKIRDYETDIKNPIHDGYDELKKYLEIICPNDKNILDFIEKERQQIQTKSLTLDVYWDRLFLFFYNVDLRNNSTSSLLELLKIHIKTSEFELERFKRLYQDSHNAHTELCNILGIV